MGAMLSCCAPPPDEPMLSRNEPTLLSQVVLSPKRRFSAAFLAALNPGDFAALVQAATKVQSAGRGLIVRSQKIRESGARPSTRLRSKTLPMAPLPCQAGGHADTFCRAPGGLVLKETCERELEVYSALEADGGLAGFFPKFDGKEENPEEESRLENDHRAILRLQDLTDGCQRPCVVDCKMGTRTFLECEVKSSKLRPDLAAKMVKLGAELTDEELKEGITKLRYMQYREETSTTATLGWRIEAIVKPGQPKFDAKAISEREQLDDALLDYLGGRAPVAAAIHARLLALRGALEASVFFATHEVVGSSLLFVYDEEDDGPPPSCWMIDFAKTMQVDAAAVPPPGLTHRAKWELGNHEDGYLSGLDSLIDVWGALKLQLEIESK